MKNLIALGMTGSQCTWYDGQSYRVQLGFLFIPQRNEKK